MAEEMVVKEALSSEMVRAGENVLQQLDQQGVRVDTAFWYYFMDAHLWRLVLSSSEVDRVGPLKVYEQVWQALASLDEPKVPFQNISFLPETSLVVEPFRQLSQDYLHARLTRSAIDGQYIDDAYIYRLPSVYSLSIETRKNGTKNGQHPKKIATARRKEIASTTF